MSDLELTSVILDSMKDPVVFADTEHIIRYMNKTAIDRFSGRGGAALIGRSLLDCHNEQSRQLMIEILAAMLDGEDERLISDHERHRSYMRAVRDKEGILIGYYERYEPPVAR